jgi:hypothetical protein
LREPHRAAGTIAAERIERHRRLADGNPALAAHWLQQLWGGPEQHRRLGDRLQAAADVNGLGQQAG